MHKTWSSGRSCSRVEISDILHANRQISWGISNLFDLERYRSCWYAWLGSYVLCRKQLLYSAGHVEYSQVHVKQCIPASCRGDFWWNWFSLRSSTPWETRIVSRHAMIPWYLQYYEPVWMTWIFRLPRLRRRTSSRQAMSISQLQMCIVVYWVQASRIVFTLQQVVWTRELASMFRLLIRVWVTSISERARRASFTRNDAGGPEWMIGTKFIKRLRKSVKDDGSSVAYLLFKTMPSDQAQINAKSLFTIQWN